MIDYVGKGRGEMSVGVAERGVGWIPLCTSTHWLNSKHQYLKSKE